MAAPGSGKAEICTQLPGLQSPNPEPPGWAPACRSVAPRAGHSPSAGPGQHVKILGPATRGRDPHGAHGLEKQPDQTVQGNDAISRMQPLSC